MDKGASATQTGPSQVEPVPVSPLRASVPSADDIGDAVCAWHEGAGDGLELFEFLGWSWQDYAHWCLSDDLIPAQPLPLAAAQAIEARRAETLGSACESPVGETDAPDATPETTQVQP